MKGNLYPWILRWNGNCWKILLRSIWLNLVGTWEFSVQPWYYIITVHADNQGTDNGSIYIESGKKRTGQKQSTMAIRLVFLMRIFLENYLLRSFIGIPMAFPHTELAALVILTMRWWRLSLSGSVHKLAMKQRTQPVFSQYRPHPSSIMSLLS